MVFFAAQLPDCRLCAGHHGFGFTGIAQQLALPLHIGAGTQYLARQTKTPCQFFGLEHRLASLAFNRGEFLLNHAFRCLALSQSLQLLPPHAHLRRPLRQDPLG